MLVKIRSSGRIVSVTDEEAEVLINHGIADKYEAIAPAGKREKAIQNNKKEAR